MTKYIIHGGYARRENESNKGFFQEFAKDVPERGAALLVFFASRDEDVPEKFKNMSSKFKAQAGEKQIEWLLATKENFIDEVQNADAVYFQGGDTDKLLEVLKQFPEFKNNLEGKTIAGSSAGAYALATYGPGHNADCVREGLGLLPIKMVCHYGSQGDPPNESSLKRLEKIAPEMETVYLEDCEWKVFTK